MHSVQHANFSVSEKCLKSTRETPSCFVTKRSDEAQLLTLYEYHKTSVRLEYAQKRITKRFYCMYNGCEPLNIDWSVWRTVGLGTYLLQTVRSSQSVPYRRTQCGWHFVPGDKRNTTHTFTTVHPRAESRIIHKENPTRCNSVSKFIISYLY
jgi:hypothetical protein